MKSIVIYAVAFLLGFVVFVIAFAPAATVWQFARTDVTRQLPDLQVMAVHGTIWSGSADIRYWNFPPTRLTWTVSPLSLVHGGLDFTAVASGDNIHLNADGTAAPSRIDATATGHIDSPWINRVSTSYGLKYSGTLTVDHLHVISDFRWFSEAAGRLHWNGGQVVYNTARGPQSIELPPLDGTLHQAGDDLHLNINQGVNTLIGITLRRTGWVAVDVKARLFETARLPWPAGESGGDTALKLEEQLFPAR